MAVLRIDPRDDSPLVVMDKDKGLFEISGKSLPEDVIDFYQPVLDWIKSYNQDPLPKTIFSFKMVYFNTASSKLILDILMNLEDLAEKGHDVLIKWHSLANDEDMQEAGVEYAEMVDLVFEHLTFQK